MYVSATFIILHLGALKVNSFHQNNINYFKPTIYRTSLSQLQSLCSFIRSSKKANVSDDCFHLKIKRRPITRTPYTTI